MDDQRSQSSVLAGLIIGPSTVTLSRSEGSVALGVEMLCYAQHDSAVTQTDARINVFMCSIGPQWAFPYPDYFLKLHYRVPTLVYIAALVIVLTAQNINLTPAHIQHLLLCLLSVTMLVMGQSSQKGKLQR